MLQKLSTIGLICLIVLSIPTACSQPTQALPTPTATDHPIPTKTITVTPSKTPTVTLTPVPSQTSTSTRKPTYTPRDTYTPKPPTETREPTETYVPVGNQIKEDGLIRIKNDVQASTLAWSPDGKTLYLGTSEEILVVDVSTQKIVTSIGEGTDVMSLAVSPDGKLLAVGINNDHSIYLIDTKSITSGKVNVVSSIGNAHQDKIWRVTFSPDGKYLASCAWDFTIKIWDLASVSLTKVIETQDFCGGLVYSPDGSRIITNGPSMSPVFVYNAASGEELARFGEAQSIDMAISPDGSMVATADMGWHTVQVFNTFSGEKLLELYTGDSMLLSVAYDPLGRYIASGGTWYNIILWNPYTGKAVYELLPDDPGALMVRFSPDGQWLAWVAGDWIYLWKVK